MKKVITFGVFDYFHLGHLRLFEKARALGDYLIVAVQEDEYIRRFKPEADVYYTLDQRTEIIRALRPVDEVTTYASIEDDIKTKDFDIFAIGADQTHQGFANAVKWCEEHGKDVVRMQRTAGVSSSSIKEAVKKLK